MKEGGTRRREAVSKVAESVGGRLEAFYYAFGEADIYAIFDMPDNVSVAALSATISATGTADLSTTVLITPEDMNEVAKKHAEYTPPGA